MSSKSKNNGRIFNGWIIAAILFVVLIIGGRFFLKSDWLLNKIRVMAVEQASKQLRGTLSVGSIRGDLLKGLNIYEVSVQDTASSEVVYIDSVNIRYDIFSLLFSPHTVESLEVYGTDALIEQYADSSWNVLQLIPPTGQPSAEPEPLYWYVENLTLSGTSIEVLSEQYLPDGFLFIEDTFANLSAGVLESGVSGTLRQLEFSIREGRLPEPVDVHLAGEAGQDRFTLSSIVINTGRSILQGSAQYEEGGEMEQNLQFSPLSWLDLSEYAAEAPIAQNLQIELGVDGTIDNLRLILNARADGLDQFQVQAITSLSEPLSLRELNISVEGLNAPLLTGIENAPVIQSLILNGEGTIRFSSPGRSNWEGTINAESAAMQPYEFDRLNTSYTFENGSLQANVNLNYQNEEIVLTARADSLFGNQPKWEFQAESNRINPAVWLQNESYDGSLTIEVHTSGTGFDANNFSGSANMSITDSEFSGQTFSSLQIRGDINQNQVEGQLSGRLEESRLDIDFSVNEWQTEPAYQFMLNVNRFNLAEVNGLGEFPTFLNGYVEGHGASFDVEKMTMTATANFDSSVVNSEEVQKLSTDLRIENQFVIVDEGLLESPIADATFSFRRHLSDVTNRTNRLVFNASLKDLIPLGPLFDIEKLQSEGSVSGNLGRNADGILEFNGDLDLENIAVDTLFSAKEISGRAVAYITDEPEFDLNIELSEPAVYQIGVQDIQLYAYALKQENELAGNISVNLQNGNDSSLRHSGEFAIDSTTTTLLTQKLDFETSLRELTLDKPFRLTYSNSTLQLDTLTISTEQGDAHLSFWAPRIDSLNQQAGLDAQNLNVGMLQQTILKESYFSGYLNGSVNVHKTPDNLEASAVAQLTDLSLSKGSMDSLKINMDVKDEWLTTELESWHENTKLTEGEFRIPFLPGDPLTFDEQFFERDVHGSFRLYESQLNYWFSFLPQGVPEATDGTLTFQGELSGVAGNPALDGTLVVSDALFSGIEIDTAGVDIAYHHKEEQVYFNGSIVRNLRRILSFEANLPFLVDLKRAKIIFPTDDDEVFADIKTNNFDLALLNSYVDREVMREIAGRLEGNVSLSGAMDHLQAEGKMQLSRGAVRILPAGITLSEVKSEVEFREDRIELRQFSAKSGPGNLQANGSINIQNLEPGQMDIHITADQFSLLNTADYNAIIDLDANLNGTTSEPRLQGKLSFLNGFYYLQDFGGSSVETVELDDEEQEESTFNFYDSLDMEMAIEFSRRFFIRNRQYLDIEVEMDGEVNLVKKPNEDLQMFGTLEGADGYAQPLGKQFELEEAFISFSGPVNDPELNVRSSYEPPQAAKVQIFYIIEGTLQEPEFRFESQPQMELQDILSYTLFGRPFYELESWEQVVAGNSGNSSAADYALEVLLDRVELLASQRLGIDVVQIDNSGSGSNNTVIKTGWYLNQNTFFAILNEIDGTNPETLFMLEILLRENLELIITQGDDTRQGIDLQWKRDY